MKRIYKNIALAALLLSVAACSKEDDFSPSYLNDPDAVHITAQVGTNDVTGGFTRSNPLGTDNEQAAFNDGDKISVAAGTQSPVTYQLGNNGWAPVGDTYLKWQTDAMNITAYYPVDKNNASATTFTVPTEYTDDNPIADADYMTFSDTQTKGDDKAINLTMQRKMVRIVVDEIKFNDQFAKDYSVTAIKVHANTKGYANGEPEAGNIEVSALLQGSDFYALLAPTTADNNSTFLTVTVAHKNDASDTHTLTVKGIPATEAGNSYSFALTVGKDKASIGTLSVNDWTTGTEIGGGMAEEIPLLTFNAAEEQTMILKQTGNAKLHESIEYSVNGGNWQPFEVETENTYKAITFGGNHGNLRMRGMSANGTCQNNSNKTTVTFGNTSVDVSCTGDIRTLVDYTNYLNASTSNARFCGLFEGCTNLISAPELPATTLAQDCYSSMFSGCTGLTTAPELPATTLAQDCYSSMFSGCTGLTTAPELPATTLAQDCYNSMFSGCTGLTTAPELPATKLAGSCYERMFYGCKSLTIAPEIKAETMSSGSCSYMFGECTSLTTAPELKATQLASSCYHCMFYNCTNLNEAPALPATTLKERCYNCMFYGCKRLTIAPELPATTLAESCYSNMFSNCTSLPKAPELPATNLANNCYDKMFSGCTSLATAPELPATTLKDKCYHYMFSGCTSLTTAPELPAETLTEEYYSYMFSECKNLTTAPEIKGTTFGEKSCYYMFYKCSNLTTVPDLNAVNLADMCCAYMFYYCTSLTKAPALPANSLVYGCYQGMFWDCKSLIEAPILPAEKLEDWCYFNMFISCKKLSNVTMLATDVSAYLCLSGWLNDVAESGTFYKNPSVTDTNNYGIPSGWNIQNYNNQ